MNRNTLTVLITAIAMGAAPCWASAIADPADDIRAARSLSRAFQYVAEQVGPSVVHIESKVRLSRRGQDVFENKGLGSGVIVSDSGIIVTNNHVIAGADALEVSLSDGRRFEAEKVGQDAPTDLAVLRLVGDEPISGLVTATFGDSEALSVGEWVVAIGSPFGFDRTVTAGIVSAKGRQTADAGSRPDLYQELIQTDAAINPGNSGGPLVNLDGEVVGINSSIISRSGGSLGIGFAIPSAMVEAVLEAILDDGIVIRGYLGVNMEDLSAERARELGLSSTAGVLITRVVERSPADTAGLLAGDVILSYQSRPTGDLARLRNAISLTSPGDTATIDLVRDGRERRVSVTIGDLIEARRGKVLRELGVVVHPIESRRTGRPLGMQLTQLVPGGPSDRAGFLEGDIIERIGSDRVRNVEELEAALSQADFDQGVRVVIFRGRKRLEGIVRRFE